MRHPSLTYFLCVIFVLYLWLVTITCHISVTVPVSIKFCRSQSSRSVSLFVSFPVSFPVFLCLSFCLFLCLSLCLFVYLSSRLTPPPLPPPFAFSHTVKLYSALHWFSLPISYMCCFCWFFPSCFLLSRKRNSVPWLQTEMVLIHDFICFMLWCGLFFLSGSSDKITTLLA